LTTRREKEVVADKLRDEYTVSDEQAKMLRMRYIENKSVGYISDLTGYSYSFVKQELATIRAMMDKLDIL